MKYKKILSDKLNKELKYYFQLGKNQMFTWMLTTNQYCNLRLKSHLVLTCNWGMANTLTGQWETAFHMLNWHSFNLKLPDVFNDYCRLPNTFSLLTKGQSFHWQMARNFNWKINSCLNFNIRDDNCQNVLPWISCDFDNWVPRGTGLRKVDSSLKVPPTLVYYMKNFFVSFVWPYTWHPLYG